MRQNPRRPVYFDFIALESINPLCHNLIKNVKTVSVLIYEKITSWAPPAL